MKEIQDGVQCFIIFTHLEVEKDERIIVITMVWEFEDVFLEEVLGIPPKREMDSVDMRNQGGLLLEDLMKIE